MLTYFYLKRFPTAKNELQNRFETRSIYSHTRFFPLQKSYNSDDGLIVVAPPPAQDWSCWSHWLASFLATGVKSLPLRPLGRVKLLFWTGASLRGSCRPSWLLGYEPLYWEDDCWSLAPIASSPRPFRRVARTMPSSIYGQQNTSPGLIVDSRRVSPRLSSPPSYDEHSSVFCVASHTAGIVSFVWFMVLGVGRLVTQDFNFTKVKRTPIPQPDLFDFSHQSVDLPPCSLLFTHGYSSLRSLSERVLGWLLEAGSPVFDWKAEEGWSFVWSQHLSAQGSFGYSDEDIVSIGCTLGFGRGSSR